MKIQDICEVKVNDDGDVELDIGLYLALRVEEDDAKTLFHFCQDMSIPKPLDPQLMHMTVYASKDYDSELDAVGALTEAVVGRNLRLEIWKSKGDEGTRMLVCRLDCEKAHNRYEEIEEEYDLKYLYKEFIPHVTLSYDLGEETLDDELDNLTYKLRSYIDEIRFDYEYIEALDTGKYKNK